MIAAQNGRQFSVAYFDAEGKMNWRDVDQNEEVQATLELPGWIMKELRRALIEEGPMDASSLDMVRDAVQVRDRLLTLVENVVNNT
jgi:hypothetical protein